MSSVEAAALVCDAEPGTCTMDSGATRGVSGLLAQFSFLSYSLVFTGVVRGFKSDLLRLKRLSFISECVVSPLGIYIQCMEFTFTVTVI